MSKRHPVRRKHPASGRRKHKHKRRRDAGRVRVNSISHAPTGSRARSTEGNKARASSGTTLQGRAADASSPNASAVPAAIRQRFVAARNTYSYPGGARAFVDRGDQLTTHRENNEVIKSLAAIAQARGWREITVNGTKRFKRELWFAARLAGLTCATISRMRTARRDCCARCPGARGMGCRRHHRLHPREPRKAHRSRVRDRRRHGHWTRPQRARVNGVDFSSSTAGHLIDISRRKVRRTSSRCVPPRVRIPSGASI